MSNAKFFLPHQAFLVFLFVLTGTFAVLPAQAAKKDITKPKSILTVACKRALSQPHPDFNYSDWLRAYDESNVNNNTLAGAYALANMMVEKNSELKLSFPAVRSLKAYADALGNPELSHPTNTEPKPGLLKRIVNRLGLKPYPAKDSLSYAPSKLTQAEWIATTFVRDVAWSLGPFGYRVVPHWIHRIFVGHMLKSLQVKLFDPEKIEVTAATLGIPADSFLKKVYATHFKELKPSKVRTLLRDNKRGILIRPGILFTALVLQAYARYGATGSPSNLSPYMYPFNEYATDPIPAYPGSDYMEDAQAAAGISLEGKKVTIIYEKNLIIDVLPEVFKGFREWIGEIDPSNLYESQQIKNKAGSYNVEVVDSVESLSDALEASGDSDVVVVNAHGRPGAISFGNSDATMEVNIEKIKPHVLKDGVLLIYTACSFADIGANSKDSFNHEYWVNLSKHIMKSRGQAVAATNNTLFTPIIIPTDSKSWNHSIKLIGVQAAVAGALIPVGIIKRGFIGPDYSHFKRFFETPEIKYRDYGKTGLGLRVYDVETDKVNYFPKAD